MLDKITYDYMIKHKCVLDEDIYSNPKIIKNFLNIYSTLKECAINESNISMVDMFIDVDIAIKKCNFTKTQLKRIDLWKAGYREFEIANTLGISNVVIHNFINNACLKISNELTRY